MGRITCFGAFILWKTRDAFPHNANNFLRFSYGFFLLRLGIGFDAFLGGLGSCHKGPDTVSQPPSTEIGAPNMPFLNLCDELVIIKMAGKEFMPQ